MAALTLAIMSALQPTGKSKGEKGMPLLFKDIAKKTALLLTFHRLELNHTATPSCKKIGKCSAKIYTKIHGPNKCYFTLELQYSKMVIDLKKWFPNPIPTRFQARHLKQKRFGKKLPSQKQTQ